LPFADEAELVARMREAIGMLEAERARYREKAQARVRERYNWEVVTTQYERLLERLQG
jgi:glycosyltransferase involved in cell wall biosynthesis